jgi:hypothetical protein
MKIRYYKELSNYRWIGFFIAMISIYILSDGDYFGNSIIQSIGWGSACLSTAFWVFIGMRDGDIPRTLMELVYFGLSVRAVVNWLA